MKKHAEMLKDACRVESFFFNGNTEAGNQHQDNDFDTDDYNSQSSPFEKAQSMSNLNPDGMNEACQRIECTCGSVNEGNSFLAKFLHGESAIK